MQKIFSKSLILISLSRLRVKQFYILIILLIVGCACNSRENSNFVAEQINTNANSNTDFNAAQSKSTPVILQESNKFRVTVPKAHWEEIYFESIHEREKISGLQTLRSKAVTAGDLEIRVWSGFGLMLLEGFVLKRSAGQWSAVDLTWETSENRKGKEETKAVDRKLDDPKSGWESVWQKLVDGGILTLPDAEEINCSGNAMDGISFVVEYNFKNNYRMYMYDNPEYAKCSEAQQMIEIIKIIDEEFHKREIKPDR